MAIKRFFYIWLLRYRLWRLQRAYTGEAWVATPALLLAINQLMVPLLLTTYTTAQGKQINLVCGFRHAGHTLTWIYHITELMQQKRYLTNQDNAPSLNRASVSLDEFLVNDHGGSIQPLDFHIHYADALKGLYSALDAVDDVRYQEYYNRRLGGLYADLFAIQEALLTVALAYE